MGASQATMRFRLGPVHEVGRDVDDDAWGLVLFAPTRPEGRRTVEDFFRGVESSLTKVLVEHQIRIYYVSVVLRTSEGIHPTTSYFLEGLTSFLREFTFAVAENRTQVRPLRLAIQLASDEQEGGDEIGGGAERAGQGEHAVLVDRSDPIVQDVTNQLCRSFWDNERFRAAAFVYVEAPVVPSSHVLDWFCHSRPGTTDAMDVYNGEMCPIPTVTVTVCEPVRRWWLLPRRGNNEHEDESLRDILRLERGGFQVMTEGPVHGTNAVRQMLALSSSMSTDEVRPWASWLRAYMYTTRAAEAFVQGLTERPYHPFERMSLCVCHPNELAVVTSGMPKQPEPQPPSHLDVGAILCRAVLRCPSVTRVTFVGIPFSPSVFDAANEALALRLSPSPTAKYDAVEEAAGSTSAELKALAFHNCDFPDPAFGPVQMAIAMTRSSNKLDHLGIVGKFLRGSDMLSVCSDLTRSDWDLTSIHIQLVYDEDNRPTVLENHQVEHFFQHLPFMRTLKVLGFHVLLPMSLSRTVVDGYKNNYWLRSVVGPAFTGELELSVHVLREIKSFVVANGKGRTTVYEAVSNPDDPQLQEKAIEVLHRLSNSDDLDDATSLFRCLQLFLPSLTRAPRPH